MTEQEALFKRLQLLKRVIDSSAKATQEADQATALEGLSAATLLLDDLRGEVEKLAKKKSLPTGRPVSPEGQKLRQQILRLLTKEQRPLGLTELIDLLEAEGLHLAAPANLLSHIRGMDEQVVKIARGLYALRDWDLSYDTNTGQWTVHDAEPKERLVFDMETDETLVQQRQEV